MTATKYAHKDVVIADNAATSGAADITDHRIIGVVFPANTWVEADLTVEIDPDGEGTYYVLEHHGTFIRLETIGSGALAARIFYFSDVYAAVLMGVSAKLRSVNVGSEVDVNQTDGPLTFKLLLEAL